MLAMGSRSVLRYQQRKVLRMEVLFLQILKTIEVLMPIEPE